MTHEDAGHYAAKHKKGIVDPDISAKISETEKNGRVSCAAAHEIALKQHCRPQIVGMNIDLLEKRINKCQMGLFGYGKKVAKAMEVPPAVSDKLEKAIRLAMTDDYISCEAAWKVAEKLRLTKIEVAGACEFLRVKVKVCQLGAF